MLTTTGQRIRQGYSSPVGPASLPSKGSVRASAGLDRARGGAEPFVCWRKDHTMPRAVFNGTVLAEADETVVVEGNHYFPPESLNREHLQESSSKTVCPWKGLASYHDVVVDGTVHRSAGWYYPRPSPLARRIRGHVAFDHRVVVEATDHDVPRRGFLDRLRRSRRS